MRCMARPDQVSGCGSAWLERLVWDQEVAGSNPVTPIFYFMDIRAIKARRSVGNMGFLGDERLVGNTSKHIWIHICGASTASHGDATATKCLISSESFNSKFGCDAGNYVNMVPF